jgi:Zn-dependent protease with chaperone function
MKTDTNEMVIASWNTAPPRLPRRMAEVPDRLTCMIAFLERATEGMALTLGVPVPLLAVERNPSVNATLVLLAGNQTVLVLSTGLIDRLRPDEACAVIAHELAHLANDDPGCPLAPSQTLGWTARAMATWQTALWALRNRRRELKADRLAAELVGVDALLGALAKSTRPTNPGGLFSTHPSPDTRMRHLRREKRVSRRRWNRTGLSAFRG